ncbi:MAG TPA: hypothetical protein VMT88_08365 [Actinomycetes bacterium]|nr:hypothetical protein [Actinomycetes bacterium]
MTFGVIGLIVVCALTGLEVWPFSGFRLFSVVRTQEQVSWELRTVDAAGVETPVDLDDLPVSYWGAHHVIPELPEMSQSDRQAAVLAWLHGANVDTDSVSSVRVYEIESLVSTEPSHAPSRGAETQVMEVPLP